MKGGAATHIHKRKKESGNARKPFPHPKFWGRVLEKATLAAGILGPLMVIPQIVEIFVTQNATGVNVWSWLGFAVLDIPFIVYGVVHKAPPIIITYAMFLLANAIVVLGVLLYG